MDTHLCASTSRPGAARSRQKGKSMRFYTVPFPQWPILQFNECWPNPQTCLRHVSRSTYAGNALGNSPTVGSCHTTHPASFRAVCRWSSHVVCPGHCSYPNDSSIKDNCANIAYLNTSLRISLRQPCSSTREYMLPCYHPY